MHFGCSRQAGTLGKLFWNTDIYVKQAVALAARRFTSFALSSTASNP